MISKSNDPALNSSSPLSRVRDILLIYGWNSTSYQIINPGIGLPPEMMQLSGLSAAWAGGWWSARRCAPKVVWRKSPPNLKRMRRG